MTILPLHMALAPRLNSKLLRKTIHGVHAQQSRESETDSRATNQWLVEGRLQPTTEAIIVAAQDGVTYTRVYHARILKHPINTN